MQRVIKNSDKRLYFLLAVLIIAWGLSWPANKEGLNFIPALWFATSRLTLACLFMFIFVGSLRKLMIPTWADLPLILAMGIFQIGFFMLFINLALEVQPAGRAAMLVYTTPLWVMPIAVFFFNEPSSFKKWLGLIIGIGGVLLLLSPWEIDWTNKATLKGSLYAIGASFSFAISILCARHMTWRRSPLELIPWQLLVASLMVFAVAVVKDPNPPLIQWNGTAIICILYTALIATALGFWGLALCSKELPSTLISISCLGVPIGGVIFSVILLHEPLDIYMIIAMLMIISGLLLVVGGGNEKTEGR